MRSVGKLIGLAGYVIALVFAAHANGAQQTSTSLAPDSYGTWFFNGGIDWDSVQGAVLTVLIGGGLRTARTLFAARPTFRVVLEGVGDAGTALVTGAILYIGMTAWASIVAPMPHAVSFVILIAGGYLRGGFLNALDDGLKRGLAVATDGAVAWVARRTGAPVPAPQPPSDVPPT